MDGERGSLLDARDPQTPHRPSRRLPPGTTPHPWPLAHRPGLSRRRSLGSPAVPVSVSAGIRERVGTGRGLTGAKADAHGPRGGACNELPRWAGPGPGAASGPLQAPPREVLQIDLDSCSGNQSPQPRCPQPACLLPKSARCLGIHGTYLALLLRALMHTVSESRIPFPHPLCLENSFTSLMIQIKSLPDPTRITHILMFSPIKQGCHRPLYRLCTAQH